jgi:hypothetical protein
LIHDALVRDKAGKLKIRSMTDIDEGLYPVTGGIYITCATIRTLENAANAATILKRDAGYSREWTQVALELRQALPVDRDKHHYTYSETADLPNGGGHLGMVFPFVVDIHSDIARNTISHAYQSYLAGRDKKRSDQVLAYTWIWALSHLATTCFYQGRGDDGYDVLSQVPAVMGPFNAPNEQMRDDIGAFLAWFTTGAGMFIYALNAMFVQVVDQHGAILLPAIPSSLQDATFSGLLATHGVSVSGRLAKGSLVDLQAESPRAMRWFFRIPEQHADRGRLSEKVRRMQGPDTLGRMTVECELAIGVNPLVQ